MNDTMNQHGGDNARVMLKAVVVDPSFSWGRDRRLEHPWHETVIYEAHVRGLSRYHLFGFSAGATVALAATLALGDAVQSLTLLEAAVIGDDD